jgi:U32 family peptidase
VKPLKCEKPELLLPAGDPEKLRYAVAYGADAVYLGLAMASLRTPNKGEQFTPANLPEHIAYCHDHQVKAYVTLNIFAGNRDIDRLIPHLEQLGEIGPDALIISDPGIFRMARQVAPHLPIHISTQANTLNYSACAFWQDLGAERVILAREVPVREMAEIHDKLPDLEIECFIHGSLCVAYSGRCMISDYLTDNTKNSNKGMCGNSCRWEFDVVEKNRPEEVYTLEEDEKGTYLLNSKDLCLVRFLPELMAAGVCSFKAEGRTKGIHYVSTVGSVYRQAIDHFAAHGSAAPEQIADWEAELMDTANRGFTEGFLHGKPNGKAYHYQSSQSQANATFVASALDEYHPDGLIAIEGRNSFSIHDDLVWMTPEGRMNAKITEAVDEQGFKIETVRPNQRVWVRPPAEFSSNALRWSLIRRKEPMFVVA